MPLGLARDSMLNLAELASKADDDLEPSEVLTEGRKESVSGSLYQNITISGDHDDSELQLGESAYEADNDNNAAAIVEVVRTPIHSKIPPDNIKLSENNPNLSSDSGKGTSFEKSVKVGDSKVKSNTHHYAGFQTDYYDFENYASFELPGNDVMLNHIGDFEKRDNNSCWQCIFPWFTSENDDALLEETFTGKEELTRDGVDQPTKIVDNDDEISKISTGSDSVMGENISQRDRQAALARLRLAQPDATKDDGTRNDTTADETSVRKKGILKNSSRPRDNPSVTIRRSVSNGSNSSPTQNTQRRALFPSYESNSIEKKNLSTSFSPMARVVTIESSKDMTSEDKSLIWWQRADYDEFRKTGRMITKVMLQGGSEIWLATNQSWQLPNQGKAATLRRAIANVDNEDASEKWWHKFGHSRRGLEHIASIDEGRQRQANVKTSIRAILAEQRRQKTFQREDPEKLRMCSIQNTSWAKDLALAAGASDADAVTKNFDEENRKSREFYLLKFSRAGKLNSTSSTKSGTNQVVPAFMKPMVSMQLRPNRFDANTTSRLKYKKNEDDEVSNIHKRVNSEMPGTKVSAASKETSKSSACVPIHDPGDNASGRESLASKAAGFANGEEAVNMSAVLTGMGPIPKSPDATHSRPVLA